MSIRASYQEPHDQNHAGRQTAAGDKAHTHNADKPRHDKQPITATRVGRSDRDKHRYRHRYRSRYRFKVLQRAYGTGSDTGTGPRHTPTGIGSVHGTDLPLVAGWVAIPISAPPPAWRLPWALGRGWRRPPGARGVVLVQVDKGRKEWSWSVLRIVQ